MSADHAAYLVVRAEAQRKADAYGFDYGIDRNAFGFRCFMLPQRKNRYGHELNCEVVSCSDLSKCQHGHGPNAVRT